MLKDTPLTIGNTIIQPKPALTKLNGARNYSLKAAERIIKESSKSNTSTVKIEWTKRQVINEKIPVFQQGKEDTKGTCLGEFADLVLP